MRSITFLACSALLATTASPASAREVEKMEPTSPWVLDYGQEYCSLVRTFGSADAPHVLRIDSFGNQPFYDLTVVGAQVPGGRRAYETKLQSPADAERREIYARPGTTDGVNSVRGVYTFTAEDFISHKQEVQRGPFGMPMITGDVVDEAYEAATDRLDVIFRTGTTLRLDTGNMGAPMRALRTCIDDLQKQWGVDPATRRNLARAPAPNEQTGKALFDFYRESGLYREQAGTVPFRVNVAADGSASGCVIQAPSLSKELDAAVCDIFSRGFTPARDAENRPVASVYQSTVMFLPMD